MARVGPAAGAPRTEGALWVAPLAWLARQLEAEQERWFLWLPVMFGAGIAFYFLLPVEPWTVAALLPVVAALAVHVTVTRGAMAALMTGALLTAALGVAAAKLRTEAVRAPVLQRQQHVTHQPSPRITKKRQAPEFQGLPSSLTLTHLH
jgi:hypothetical protein